MTSVLLQRFFNDYEKIIYFGHQKMLKENCQDFIHRRHFLKLDTMVLNVSSKKTQQLNFLPFYAIICSKKYPTLELNCEKIKDLYGELIVLIELWTPKELSIQIRVSDKSR